MAVKKQQPKLFQGITSAKSRFRKATGFKTFEKTLHPFQSTPKLTFSSLFKIFKKAK